MIEHKDGTFSFPSFRPGHRMVAVQGTCKFKLALANFLKEFGYTHLTASGTTSYIEEAFKNRKYGMSLCVDLTQKDLFNSENAPISSIGKFLELCLPNEKNIRIGNDYNAEISDDKSTVEIGCQKIPKKIVEEILNQLN